MYARVLRIKWGRGEPCTCLREAWRKGETKHQLVTKIRAVVFQEVRFPIKQAPFHFHLAKTSGFGLFFLCQTYKQSGALEEALLAANYCRNDVRYFYLVGI